MKPQPPRSTRTIPRFPYATLFRSRPEDIGMAAAAMTHWMTTGTPPDIRVRVRVVQGGYRWFRATAYPRRDEKGNVIRWYGYTEDIHEHVLVEQKIRWTAAHDALKIGRASGRESV